jgi:hypothetical protein
MALLTKLLLWPVEGITWIAQKVAEQVDRELYSEEAVRGKLTEMELRYDLGEISEEEYLAAEEVLLERLKVIRERRAAESEE